MQSGHLLIIRVDYKQPAPLTTWRALMYESSFVRSRNPKWDRVDTLDPFSRRKTLSLLQKMKDHCKKMIEKSEDGKRKDFFTHVVVTIDESLEYLEANEHKSNIRLTRFYRFLTPLQRMALHQNKITKLIDLTHRSRNDLRLLLRQGNHSPSFLTILGS